MAVDCQQQLGPVAILHTGGRHYDGQDQSRCIDQDVTLAFCDLLVRVKAASTSKSRAEWCCEHQIAPQSQLKYLRLTFLRT
jgi:hypothetical protein